jgi:thiopeptide-type bacteriocin biosynthesis protein
MTTSQPLLASSDLGRPPPARPTWHQASLRFADYDAAETAATQLAQTMTEAERAGLVASWWFIRKAPCWRLRFQPAPGDGPAGVSAAAAVFARLDELRDDGQVAAWTETIYEPETHTFGGPAGMDLAHRLFYYDSRHVLAHLATLASHADLRRELSILLCCTLMRAAGQDWYEQGDIWARVAKTRPNPPGASGTGRQLESRLHRLLTADTGPGTPLTSTDGPLASFTAWAEVFTDAGRDLQRLAHEGNLGRGLRAVLAHHVLFHWNRLGLPYPTQALLAQATANVILR